MRSHFKNLFFESSKWRQLFVILTAVFFIACGTTEKTNDLSPAETLKRYVAASQKKDSAAMKQYLSKSSLEFLEKSANTKNITLDELLKMESEVQNQTIPETRNEIIEGESASVEAKNTVTGAFDMKIPFVREDGVWKIARDKYIQEQIRILNEQMNMPVGDSNSNTSNK